MTDDKYAQAVAAYLRKHGCPVTGDTVAKAFAAAAAADPVRTAARKLLDCMYEFPNYPAAWAERVERLEDTLGEERA